MLAITDSPSAVRYGLNAASLIVPNTSSAVLPDVVGMTNALSGLRPTSLDTVKQVDPAQVPANGYPLTIVTYAGVNLSKSTTASRATVSEMLKQVTSSGQVSGTAIGQLPAGYLPLTDELKAQAAVSANDVKAFVAPSSATGGRVTDDGGTYVSYFENQQPGTTGQGADPALTQGVDTDATKRTGSEVAVEPIARSGLAVAMGVGLAGFVFAPILFRGRGFL
jgi:hypothetical protein